MIGREQIEVLFAGLVVAGESFLHRLTGNVGGDRTSLAHVERGRFEHGQGTPGVSVGFDGHEGQRAGSTVSRDAPRPRSVSTRAR